MTSFIFFLFMNVNSADQGAESNVLSAFDCKVQGRKDLAGHEGKAPAAFFVSASNVRGDPPVELLHKWRTGARAAGVNYGRDTRQHYMHRKSDAVMADDRLLAN